MVGLVLVSHCRNLAEAACALAKSVSRTDMPMDFAGGIGDDRADLGTDATDIMEAIMRVHSGDGVLVLMDLGSAVLSARLAQQMLEDDCPGIRLCPAPLVEGAVAAAVQIAAGESIDTVYAEARNGLLPKLRDIEGEDEPHCSVAPASPAGEEGGIPPDALLFRFIMNDPNGMHTRPAAEFVRAVSGHSVTARVRNASGNGPFVNAMSLNQLALSNIRQGDTAEAALWGPDAAIALEALRKLVRDVYHSREAVPPARREKAAAPPVARPAPLAPARLSPGVGVGLLHRTDRSFPELAPRYSDDPEAEIAALEKAVAEAHEAIAGQQQALEADREDEAAIIGAQLLILDDREVLAAVAEGIRKQRQDAATVYQRHMLNLAEQYRALPNEYMRERAADVDGVAEQVLSVLTGKPLPDIAQYDDVILWAREVTPTTVSRFGKERLKGILTETGGLSSHVAIMAKSMNIPAITGYRLPEDVASGTAVAMDATTLEIVLRPDAAQTEDFARRCAAWKEALAGDFAAGQGEAVTADGKRVPVFANVGDAAGARAAARNGAEGIGLLRTEFLYINRLTPPTEEEQMALLADVFKPFAGRPITVRTLDIGGDKSLPWLDLPVESNPFLGMRGVRLYLHDPALFKTQLRAILRAGNECDLHLMAPMISIPEEVRFVRQTLEQAAAELDAEALAHCRNPRFGIMIETPAAVLQAEALAAMVDFFSIGTNDLTQYVMSAERGSSAMPLLTDGMHPAVLKAIGMVVEGAAKHNTEVAVCGEMAGEVVSARAMLGLGVDLLSMNAPAVGGIKRAIRQSSLKTLVERAGQAVSLGSAAETRALFS